jgi:hypothetical protein
MRPWQIDRPFTVAAIGRSTLRILLATALSSERPLLCSIIKENGMLSGVIVQSRRTYIYILLVPSFPDALFPCLPTGINYLYLDNEIRQPKACAKAALSLLTCMEETQCVKKDGKCVFECMKDDKDSADCNAQQSAYYLCKHSQLNMRTRIRGTRAY